MQEKITREFKCSVEGVDTAVVVKYAAGAPKAAQVKVKAAQFVNWAEQPDQKELDLTVHTQVEFKDCTLSVEKPGKTRKTVSLGTVLSGTFEAMSAVYNMMQAGKNVTVIVREQAKKAKKK